MSDNMIDIPEFLRRGDAYQHLTAAEERLVAQCDALSAELHAIRTLCGGALEELRRAIEKFPTWPSDPVHAAAVLGEEYGELQQAIIQAIYEPHKCDEDAVRAEAIQVAAMALRFVSNLDRYEYAPAKQHYEPAPQG